MISNKLVAISLITLQEKFDSRDQEEIEKFCLKYNYASKYSSYMHPVWKALTVTLYPIEKTNIEKLTPNKVLRRPIIEIEKQSEGLFVRGYVTIFSRDLNGHYKDITQDSKSGRVKLNRIRHLNIGQPGRALEWYEKYINQKTGATPIIRSFLLDLVEIDRLFEFSRPTDQPAVPGQFELKRGEKVSIKEGSLLSICEKDCFNIEYDGLFLDIESFSEWFFGKKTNVKDGVYVKSRDMFEVKHADEISADDSCREFVSDYLFAKVCSRENFMDIPSMRRISERDTPSGRIMKKLFERNRYVVL